MHRILPLSVCILIGLLAAGAVYALHPVLYESKTKLLVRHVVDRNETDHGRKQTQSITAAELEILRSHDLALEVAEAIGVTRLANASEPPSTGTRDPAQAFQRGLQVSNSAESNVLTISFRSRDPEVPVAVLEELTERFFARHLEYHRRNSSANPLLQKLERARARVIELEEELRWNKALQNEMDAGQPAAAAGEIQRLEEERKRARLDVTEAQNGLDQARVEEMLDPSKVPNVSVLEKASPPVKHTGWRDPVAIGIAATGLALGLILSWKPSSSRGDDFAAAEAEGSL